MTAEREYWQKSDFERPGSWSLELLTLKMTEARVLLEKLARFEADFTNNATIVEIGAGQAWGSCVVREQFPGSVVVATELAYEALYTTPRWATVIGDHPTAKAACISEELPLRDGSVDLVFAFAAAHHFADMNKVMREISRVLRKGGVALFLHEPSSPRWINAAAVRRVNAKRPEVPENVLVSRDVAALATAAGLQCELHHAPTTTSRGAFETLYYLVLSHFAPLRYFLPCTMDYRITKV